MIAEYRTAPANLTATFMQNLTSNLPAIAIPPATPAAGTLTNTSSGTPTT